MKRSKEMLIVEEQQMKKNLPLFKVGDTVNVHMRILEAEKERVQIFTGTVIARKGSGLSETFSLYRVSYGSAIERVFMLHSPKIAQIEIVKQGKARKSKLGYIRGLSGKKAKIAEKIGGRASSAKIEQVTAESAT